MRVRRWSALVACVAALAMTVSACGSNGSSNQANKSPSPSKGGGGNGGTGGSGAKASGPLKIGYVLPETGTLAYLGPPQIDATKYAIQQINAAGGVLGKPIPPPPGGDEADDSAVAAQSAQRVLNDGVDAIIGAAASGMSLAFIDKVTGSHVVQCSGSNTAPTFTNYNDGGYYFRTAPSDALQGPVLANTVIRDGHSKVAIVARADDYGKGLANATAESLQSAGATVALNQTYDPKTTDFGATINAIKNVKPDAVVVIAFEEGAQILKGLIEQGLGPDKIGVYGADGLRSEDLGHIVSPQDPGVLSGMKGTAPASAENKQFTAALKKFDPKLHELQFAPQVFDCVTIIALAAEQAGTNDASKFKNEIVGITKDGTKCTSFADCKKLIDQGKNVDYDGASGPLDFTSAGEPRSATIEVYGYNAKGKLVTLKTEKSNPSSS